MLYWFSRELCWKEKIDDKWVEVTPMRPEWAQQQEDIPAARFIPVWVAAHSLNDVKKIFFWKTVEELQEQHAEINQWLDTNEYEGIATKELRTDELLNPEECLALENQGLIVKKTHTPSKEYTPDPDPYLPRQHIQVSEGGFRFQARH